MRQHQAVVVIDFLDANQTLRNAFAEWIQAYEWERYPGMANAYCITYDSDACEADVVAQTEFDLMSAAHGAGLRAWDAVCLLDDSVVVISDPGLQQTATSPPASSRQSH